MRSINTVSIGVTDKTPPTYITHAADDRTVEVDNSIAYFQSLRRNKVEVVMHIYPKGVMGLYFVSPMG